MPEGGKVAPKGKATSFEGSFVKDRVLDSSKGPPCGVCHHQGSTSGKLTR